MSYETRKAFKTSSMPEEVFNYLYDNNLFVEDGFYEYEIGYFAAEVENAHPNDRHKYCDKDYQKSKAADAYFLANGAENGEKILVWHS